MKEIEIIDKYIYLGYIISALIIFSAFTGFYSFAYLLGIFDGILWFICIYKFHKILHKQSKGTYPISSGKAVGYHFIPIFNIYWIFKWPIEMSKYIYINSNYSIKILSGEIIGLLLLIAFILNRVIGIGSIFIFLIGSYLTDKIQNFIILSTNPLENKLDNNGEQTIICANCGKQLNYSSEECPQCGSTQRKFK